jgi:hypothetical protein
MATLSIGQTVQVKGLTYTIKNIQLTAEAYPNIKKARPNFEYHIIVVGKRGAGKDGVILTDGTIKLY